MGRDLKGRNYTSPEGRALSLNVWSWGILVKFVWMFAANEAALCKDWASDDSEGMNAEETAKLVAKLKAARDRGAVANFIAMHPEGVSDMPVLGGARRSFVKHTPAIIDEFITFAEASGGWATFETLAMEAMREGRMVTVTGAEREALEREMHERVKTEVMEQFMGEHLKRKTAVYVNLQEWAKPREGMTIADVEAVIAERKAEGLRIDPATCERVCRLVEEDDPYSLLNLRDEEEALSPDLFMRNPDGEWVWFGDVPEATLVAMLARVEKEYSNALPAPSFANDDIAPDGIPF